MQIIESITDMHAWTTQTRVQGHTIGLVPTMGCLHNGHTELFKEARKANDRVVASIFVNPLQFRQDAYEKYPRRFDADIQIAKSFGLDAVFAPSTRSMYPDASSIDWLFTLHDDPSYPRQHNEFASYQVGTQQAMNYIRVPSRLVMKLDGQKHPWHFDGVATVVNQLFNIINPHRAYFGQKDIQQLAILHAMNTWIKSKIDLVQVPIVRDEDGLALSSRLVLLNDAERSIVIEVARQIAQHATVSSANTQANTQHAQTLIKDLKSDIQAIQTHEHTLVIDSIECVDPTTLESVETVEKTTILYAAYIINGIRLTETKHFV